ncbi:MAG: sulfatase-like hydrolase/transferase, partial [Chloroflexota bacterium]
LDALAARGVRFENAISPSPLCAPARACLASGRDYHRARVATNRNDYPLDQPTYYAMLREAEYHVAGVGKFDLRKASFDWGIDGQKYLREWGFTEGINSEGKWDAIMSATGSMPPALAKHAQQDGLDSAALAERARNAAAETIPPIKPKGPYIDFLHRSGLAETHIRDFWDRDPYQDTRPTPLPDDAYCDNWIAANALRLLANLPNNQPWHLVVNFAGPHDPVDVTQSMHERWQGIHFPAANDNHHLDAATHGKIRCNYAAIIENIDRHLGQLIQAVHARGELDNTMIVYSSDHGEMLGDHNLWGKKTYYQPSVGVPLIIAGPGIVSDVVCRAPVALHDLAPTFLEYAAARPLPDADAVSLEPILAGQATQTREFVISGLQKWRMVFDGRFKLVIREGQDPILFDLETDPLERSNIAATRSEQIRAMKKILDQTLRD